MSSPCWTREQTTYANTDNFFANYSGDFSQRFDTIKQLERWELVQRSNRIRAAGEAENLTQR
jgi:hypothetical protein